MKEWQKIIVGIFCIAAIFITLDYIFGGMIESLYKNSKYGIFRHQIYSLTESNEDILIMGSSRASHQYVSSVFKDSLNMSTYNCGSDGMCIYYHYAILASYIERGVKPKLVILDVMDLDAEQYSGPTFGLDAALDRLAPHFGEFACIDSLFNLKDWKEQIKLRSKAYRFNSKLVQAIKCNYIPSPEDNGYEVVNGYLPDTTKLKISDYEPRSLDSTKILYLHKFISLAKRNDIDLILVQSPKYERVISDGINAIKQIAESENITFWDYADEPTLMNPHLFRDYLHLNDHGAHLWSTFIANKIKEDYY